jgi:hypothetical protein
MKKIDLILLSTFIPIFAISCYLTYLDFNKFKSGPAFGLETTQRVNIIDGILIIEFGLMLLLSISKLNGNSIILKWIYNHDRYKGKTLRILGIMCTIMGIFGLFT